MNWYSIRRYAQKVVLFHKNSMKASTNGGNENIIAILAHKIDEFDNLVFRVQFSDMRFQWVSGESLKEKYQTLLLDYWGNESVEYIDDGVQTSPRASFDFEVDSDDKISCLMRNYVDFNDNLTILRKDVHGSAVPKEIVGIDLEKEVALVRLFCDKEIEMSLKLLLNVKPELIAEYYLKEVTADKNVC